MLVWCATNGARTEKKKNERGESESGDDRHSLFSLSPSFPLSSKRAMAAPPQLLKSNKVRDCGVCSTRPTGRKDEQKRRTRRTRSRKKHAPTHSLLSNLLLFFFFQSFGGVLRQYRHASPSLGCDMEFRVFFPESCDPSTKPTPALIFLSGLTCTPANASEKAPTAQAAAAAAGLALVFPDTSPRGLGVPGEDEGWDLGTGAGFYVDATRAPWVTGGAKTGYRMASYITQDLLGALESLGIHGPLGLTGHSMGGHGALVLGLKHPSLFASISAFSPIAHPSACPWGVKAFSAYLGGGGGSTSPPAAWAAWDATALAASYSGPHREILIDVGTDDEFLRDGQLRCGDFVAAAVAGATGGSGSGPPPLTVHLREQTGYDHSYFFIATFAADHVAHHAKVLVGGEGGE